MAAFPCKDCKHRVLNCHSSCEEYQEALVAKRKKSEELYKAKLAEKMFRRKRR